MCHLDMVPYKLLILLSLNFSRELIETKSQPAKMATNLKYKGKKLMLFPDLPLRVVQKCRTFHQVHLIARQPRKKRLNFLYPAIFGLPWKPVWGNLMNLKRLLIILNN